MLDTKQTQLGHIIRSARDQQRMTLQEFGDALSVTKSLVNQWEDGFKMPSSERVAAWVDDEREWVRHMGLDIFRIRHGVVIRSVLLRDTEPVTA